MSKPLAVVRLHSNDSSLFLVYSYNLAPHKSYTLVPFCWQYSWTTLQKPQVFLSWWFLDDVKLSLEIYPFDEYRTIHLNLNPMLQCCTLIKMSVNPYKTSHISNIRKVSPFIHFLVRWNSFNKTPLSSFSSYYEETRIYDIIFLRVSTLYWTHLWRILVSLVIFYDQLAMDWVPYSAVTFL